MKPLQPYWRKAAKRALKSLHITKRKPRVVRTQPPQCAWRDCHRVSVGGGIFCARHRNWPRYRDMPS